MIGVEYANGDWRYFDNYDTCIEGLRWKRFIEFCQTPCFLWCVDG